MKTRSTHSNFDPQPVLLQGEVAQLEPLSLEHAPGLFEVGRDEAVWTHLPRAPFADPEDVSEWIAQALHLAESGGVVPFAIRHRPSDRVAGSTRFMEIRRPHGGLEIGWTWLGREFQRSAVNTECKRLLLTHAFEVLGAERVEFKTDLRNERSQRAIERLGAQREGVHRKHLRVRDGFMRDSVYYSVIADEWPEVRRGLDRALDRG